MSEAIIEYLDPVLAIEDKNIPKFCDTFLCFYRNSVYKKVTGELREISF